jgi:hypothetical protein
MTIVVACATPDGLVLAADSRTTQFPDAEGHRTRIASDSADKLFIMCGRYGVATFGDAFIGEQTITGLMSEFIAQLEPAPDSGATIAASLAAFFDARYLAWREQIGDPVVDLEPTALGFIVAGYDEDGIGQLHEVSIPGGTVEDQRISTTSVGMVPRGQRDVIDRLLAGVDFGVLEALEVDVPEDVGSALRRLAYKVLFPITLQDGIDFASFLIRTTIDMQRFSDGTHAFSVGLPGCGGPTKIAVVRRREAEWITPSVLRANGPAGRAEGALGA